MSQWPQVLFFITSLYGQALRRHKYMVKNTSCKYNKKRSNRGIRRNKSKLSKPKKKCINSKRSNCPKKMILTSIYRCRKYNRKRKIDSNDYILYYF